MADFQTDLDLMTSIAKISDWRLHVDEVGKSIIYPEETRLPTRLPQDHYEFAEALAQVVKEKHQEALAERMAGDNFEYSFLIEDFYRLRYRVQPMDSGMYSLRTLAQRIRPFSDLSCPAFLQNFLLNQNLSQGGFILASGVTGSGKSSTIASITAERLKRFGGEMITVEDPPEFPLEGFHGESGYCNQLRVRRGNYEERLSEALRCFSSQAPQSILLYGEVRREAEAKELLRIAVDGHLVFSTIHAANPIAALKRLFSLACGAMSEHEARSLLGESLKMVLHQRFQNRMLTFNPLEGTEKVAAHLRAGQFDNLNNELELQTRSRNQMR